MRRSSILFLYKEPLLTSKQLDKLSDICIIIGQLSAASMVLPFIIPQLDRAKLPMLVLGVLLTLVSWIASMLLVRRIE